MEDKVDMLFFPEVEGYQIFPIVAKGWRIPFYFLGNILVGMLMISLRVCTSSFKG
jgi:hypothetical protein